MSEPIASRKNKYWPPAFGNIAASSPYARAPSSVMTPVTIQTTSNQNGEPTDRAMSAETMKMPDPIMAPATSIVASTSVSALTNSCGVSVVAGRSATTVVMQLLNWMSELSGWQAKPDAPHERHDPGRGRPKRQPQEANKRPKHKPED